jgi:Na+/H+ antiporter NhaC
MDSNSVSIKQDNRFYFGSLGAALPFLIFLALIVVLSITKQLSSESSGAVGFVALLASFILIKDKGEFGNAVVRGLTNKILALMLISFLLAGVMAKALEIGGLVKSLVWLVSRFGVTGHLMPAAIFLIGGLISFATGSSGSTIMTMMPIMLPFGLALGCKPALVMGAIVAGAMFGDNIAPISDTTIVSALSQEIEVSKVVRARLKYSCLAGFVALCLFIVFGLTTTAPALAQAADMQDVNPMALFLLVCPAVVIYLMLKGKDLIFSLIIASGLSVLICILLGLIKITDIISKSGVVVTGFSSMMGIFTFFYFIYILIELLQYGGVMERMTVAALKIAKTPRSAELVSALITVVACLITASHAISVVLSGPLVRQVMKNHNVSKARSANIIDCCASGVFALAPHSSLLIFVMGLALPMNILPEGFAITDFIPYIFHSWALLLIFFGSILTGWGRSYEGAPAGASGGKDN